MYVQLIVEMDFWIQHNLRCRNRYCFLNECVCVCVAFIYLSSCSLLLSSFAFCVNYFQMISDTVCKSFRRACFVCVKCTICVHMIFEFSTPPNVNHLFTPSLVRFFIWIGFETDFTDMNPQSRYRDKLTNPSEKNHVDIVQKKSNSHNLAGEWLTRQFGFLTHGPKKKERSKPIGTIPHMRYIFLWFFFYFTIIFVVVLGSFSLIHITAEIFLRKKEFQLSTDVSLVSLCQRRTQQRLETYSRQQKTTLKSALSWDPF